MSKPRGQRTVPGSKEPTARPILRGPGPKANGGIVRLEDGIRIDPDPPELLLPTPHPLTPDARTTRVTALNAAARIHAGRGTSPYRVIADAEVLGEYLRIGVVVEDPAIAESMERFVQAAKDGHSASVVLPGYELTYEPPKPEPRRRWWRR